MSSRFPAAFRPPAFASWASCSRHGFGSPYGRLTGARAPDPDGVSMFRTREMRLGKGVLYTPGTAVPTRPRMLHDRRLPHHSGASLISPVLHPAREVMLTRHHQGFPVSRPVPSLPLACDPRPERGPLGFSMSSAPGRYRPRTSWRGQVTDTIPKSRHRHQPASMSDGLTPHVRPHVAGITHASSP
jgi:hypothetical protein